jgi:hypothetical protein
MAHHNARTLVNVKHLAHRENSGTAAERVVDQRLREFDEAYRVRRAEVILERRVIFRARMNGERLRVANRCKQAGKECQRLVSQGTGVANVRGSDTHRQHRGKERHGKERGSGPEQCRVPGRARSRRVHQAGAGKRAGHGMGETRAEGKCRHHVIRSSTRVPGEVSQRCGKSLRAHATVWTKSLSKESVFDIGGCGLLQPPISKMLRFEIDLI